MPSLGPNDAALITPPGEITGPPVTPSTPATSVLPVDADQLNAARPVGPVRRDGGSTAPPPSAAAFTFTPAYGNRFRSSTRSTSKTPGVLSANKRTFDAAFTCTRATAVSYAASDGSARNSSTPARPPNIWKAVRDAPAGIVTNGGVSSTSF